MVRPRIDWQSITEDDVQRRESALATLLQQMDIPAARTDTSDVRHLRWLNRNIAINNGKHPMLDTAQRLLVWLLRWHAHSGA